MKKYLLGVFALILAIGLSAFSNSFPAKKTTQDLYWYFYDDGDNELAGQIGSGLVSHATAKDATTCPDDSEDEIDCARGYSMPQTPTQSNPGPGDEQVKRPEN